MPRPNKEIVIERLQKLLKQADELEERGPDFHQDGDFKNWSSDVEAWLKKGSPYSEAQYGEFRIVTFAPFGFNNYGFNNRVSIWTRAFKRTRHIINQAIEHIVEEWEVSAEDIKPVVAADNASRNITILNQINQYNSLTIRDVLEGVAGEIEKKDAAEGGRFKSIIKKWGENPLVKTVLESAATAAIKSVIPGA